MGCSSSKEDVNGAKGDFDQLGQDTALLAGPLTAKDYKSRLASSEGTQTVCFKSTGITVRYAFVSLRGYYPDSPGKANQDSLCVHTHFGGDPEQVFFGVFDGHGEYGTQCSQFAKDKVPENVLNNAHFAVSPEIAYHRSMVLTNNQLHRQPDVDDSMSGTTAITLLLRSKAAYVANVGDSRAVVAERRGDRLVAQDMSFDQTPFRRDECERVKRCGARVLTLDQLEGLKDPHMEHWGTEEDNDGDPPRLWAPNATYPGTAFTRSIGDSAAERIGVFAEPEVVVRSLSASNPFIVLASDGVWEFLTSQSVIDMVSKFDDPQEACMSVVAESYRLWLAHETRTDDITMVVIQVQGIAEDVQPLSAPTPLGALLDYSSRPGGSLRRVPTSRMAPIEPSPASAPQLAATSPSPPLGSSGAQPSQPQAGCAMQEAQTAGQAEQQTSSTAGTLSERELELLEAATDSCLVFMGMSPTERLSVFKAMARSTVKAGQLVIRQGDPGDLFYIVDTGLYDVYLAQAPACPPELVHTYGHSAPETSLPASASASVEHLSTRDSFGELALLYSKPRAATVVARTDGSLWSLHRAELRAVLQASEVQAARGRDVAAVVRALRNVEVLHCLAGSHLTTLAEAMQEVSLASGQFVIRQGDEGSDFFLLRQGEVVCTVRTDADDAFEVPREVLRLGPGQHFGERTLLTAAWRAANVVTVGPVTLLAISRCHFEQVMGTGLQALINAEAVWHEQLALQREVLARKNASAVHLQGHFSLDDLIARGLLFSTDCSALMLMEHRTSEDIFTVRVTSVADVVAAGKQALVMCARDITRSLEPSFFVPGVLQNFKDIRVLSEVLMTVGLCTLDMLLATGPLDELSTQFVVASVVLALEHLHWSHIIYRGLGVHSIIVTEGGQVQLVDFRFARKDEGRAYTLCGNPEYLAPEVVQGRGHGPAADLWALGVLLHCLLRGETPFASPGDDELRIYRKICSVGAFDWSASGLAPGVQDLLQGLLVRDPAQRLGCGPHGLAAVKAHPWFSAIDWDALLEHRYPPPPGIRERIYNFEGVAYAHFDPQPYEGDMRWCENF